MNETRYLRNLDHSTFSYFNYEKQSNMVIQPVHVKKRKVHFIDDIQNDMKLLVNNKDVLYTSPISSKKTIKLRHATPMKQTKIERFHIDDESNESNMKLYDIDKPFESPLIVDIKKK